MLKGSIIRPGILTAVILTILIGIYAAQIRKYLPEDQSNANHPDKQKTTEGDIVVMKAFSGQVISECN